MEIHRVYKYRSERRFARAWQRTGLTILTFVNGLVLLFVMIELVVEPQRVLSAIARDPSVLGIGFLGMIFPITYSLTSELLVRSADIVIKDDEVIVEVIPFIKGRASLDAVNAAGAKERVSTIAILRPRNEQFYIVPTPDLKSLMFRLAGYVNRMGFQGGLIVSQHHNNPADLLGRLGVALD